MPAAKKQETEEIPSETAAEESVPVNGEVVRRIDWGKVDNIGDARALLESHNGAVLDASKVLGDGAELIEDKDRLINIPFLVLDWRFIVDQKTTNEYASVLVMNGEGAKARFNDGSTGVYAQLKKVTEEYGINGGLQCKRGLRKSEYTVEADGKPTRAVTYYLAG